MGWFAFLARFLRSQPAVTPESVRQDIGAVMKELETSYGRIQALSEENARLRAELERLKKA